MANGDDVVESMFDEGVRRWPHVHVDSSVFRAHCDRVFAAGVTEDIRHFGAELYLCCACAARDREAMAAFEREGAPTARAAIARVSRDEEFVRETLQELWERLLFGPKPKIARYSGRGPLYAWLRVVAARFALDRCRARRLEAERELGIAEHIATEHADPAVRLVRTRYGRAFQDAVEHAISELSSTDRNLLRLQTRSCTIDQIGKIYGVHRATAARWLDRARARVLDSVRARLARSSVPVTDGEFASIARDIQGELELGLSRISEETALTRSSPSN